jgi:hypothetical protein
VALDELKNTVVQDEDPNVLNIKKQLDNHQPVKILFALTRKPNLLTLKNIENEGANNPRIDVMVHTIQREPPEASDDLLKSA